MVHQGHRADFNDTRSSEKSDGCAGGGGGAPSAAVGAFN